MSKLFQNRIGVTVVKKGPFREDASAQDAVKSAYDCNSEKTLNYVDAEAHKDFFDTIYSVVTSRE